MILSVFGDESSDAKRKYVFAVSAVMGTESEWKDIEAVWLERTGGEVFHAADCEHQKKFDLYKDLTQLLATGPVAGTAVALDLVAFQRTFPDTLPDVGYFQCLSKVVAGHATRVRLWNQRVAANPTCGDPQIDLKFVFDSRTESASDVGILYSTFTNQPEWKGALFLGSELSFASRENPRIQIADLIVREARKDLERQVGPVSFPKRKSFVVLECSERFKFSVLGNDYCSALKTDIERGDNFMHGYEAWLNANTKQGRPRDSWGRRFQYMAWLDNQAKADGPA